MRKFTLLVAGVALAVGVLAACVPPPPPPPTDPHDVLVVGDSVAFSFGCVLGDALDEFPFGCPPQSGYSTRNASVGACTTYGVTALLYNGGGAPVPNCDTVAAPPENRTWAQLGEYYDPKVVVINTHGWEIVDRWLSFVAVPDSQWGGSTGGQAYQNAAVYYSAALYNQIANFRAGGAKVLVANAPYANPLQPVPDPATTPAGLGCSWWEPYPDSPPTAQGDPPLSPLTCPGQWTPPRAGVTYRSSRVKMDQLNEIMNQVLTNPNPQFGFGSDPNVKKFNFAKHFNGPNNVYTDYVCPPPQDFVEVPDGSNNCSNGPAILARAPDNGHLSTAGQFDVLQPYLDSCVRSMLGIGGSAADCA